MSILIAPSRTIRRNIALLPLLACFGPASAFAQRVSGTISGVVKDPQGAAIVSAAVVARHPQTGTVISTLTAEDGYYRLQNLIPGEHIIEITAAGFRRFTSSPQLLSVSEPIRLDVMLEI